MGEVLVGVVLGALGVVWLFFVGANRGREPTGRGAPGAAHSLGRELERATENKQRIDHTIGELQSEANESERLLGRSQELLDASKRELEHIKDLLGKLKGREQKTPD